MILKSIRNLTPVKVVKRSKTGKIYQQTVYRRSGGKEGDVGNLTAGEKGWLTTGSFKNNNSFDTWVSPEQAKINPKEWKGAIAPLAGLVRKGLAVIDKLHKPRAGYANYTVKVSLTKKGREIRDKLNK